MAPGFVDLHTHYDAQLFWDPTASPVPAARRDHRVRGELRLLAGPGRARARRTTCAAHDGPGGGDAPGRPEAGLDWSWGSFADWLGRLDGAVGVNAGFLVGHSTLRRAVMGDESGGPAGPGQVAAMVSLLGAALDARVPWGSRPPGPRPTTTATARRCPSRAAGRRRARARWPPGRGASGHHRRTDRARLPQRVQRRGDGAAHPALHPGRPPGQLERAGRLRRPTRGRPPTSWRPPTGCGPAAGPLVALTLPHTMALRLSFEHGAILDGLPGLAGVLRPAGRPSA